MLQNVIDFKAKSFLSERNTSTMAYEVKAVRALWDPSLSIPGTNRRGGWRCPVGTRYGGQITDRFGRSCGWGVARRIANQISDIGQRLENVDDVRRGERVARRERRILGRLNPQDRGAGRLEQGLRGIAERLDSGSSPSPRGARRRTVVARPPSVDAPETPRELTPAPPAPRAPRRRRAPNLRESEQRRIDREIEQPGAPRTGEVPVRPTRPIPNREVPELPKRDDKDPYVENLRTMSDEDLEKQYQDAKDSVDRLRDAVDKPRDDGMIGMLPVSVQRLTAKQRLDKVNAELNRRGKRPPRRQGNLRDSEARRMERELVQPGAPRTGEAPARRRRRAVVEATQKPKAPTRREEQREITPVNFEGMNEVDLQPIPEGIRNMTDQEIETELRKKGGVSRERTQFLLREQAARKLRADGKDKPEADLVDAAPPKPIFPARRLGVVEQRQEYVANANKDLKKKKKEALANKPDGVSNADWKKYRDHVNGLENQFGYGGNDNLAYVPSYNEFISGERDMARVIEQIRPKNPEKPRRPKKNPEGDIGAMLDAESEQRRVPEPAVDRVALARDAELEAARARDIDQIMAPPQRPMLRLAPPPIGRVDRNIDGMFTQDQDKLKINDAINNVNFDLVNNYDNMQNYGSENLQELNDLLEREKQLQETLKQRLTDASQSWRNLGADPEGARRNLVRDRFLVAWAAQQGSEEKIKQMDMRKVEIEANIAWTRRNVPQRQLVNDPLNPNPQPFQQRNDPRRFDNPKLAEEFKVVQNLNFSEVNDIKREFAKAKNENPVMYTSANLQRGLHGDVEQLNAIIASNSVKATEFNNEIRDQIRAINNGLDGKERKQALQKAAIAIQGRERMYEENRIISAVVAQNPFGIDGALREPPEAKEGLGFKDKFVADIDDPSVNAEVQEILDSVDANKYPQAKEFFKASLQKKLDEYANWEPRMITGLFNGDFGNAAQIAARLEQATELLESHKKAVTEELALLKSKVSNGDANIDTSLDRIAQTKISIARVELELRLLTDFRDGKLTPPEKFKVGEPKGIADTPENLKYRPAPVKKMLDDNEKKFLEEAVLKISDVEQLQQTLAMIDEKTYDVMQIQQELEMLYVDDLTKRVEKVVKGQDIAVALNEIQVTYVNRGGNDGDDLAKIEEYQAEIRENVEKLEQLAKETDPVSYEIQRAVSNIGNAKREIAGIESRMRNRNNFRRDFELSLQRVQEGHFTDPNELEGTELTPEKLQLDIDAGIEKAISKRNSKVEQYLENQFPDYGGDPEDTSNILPSFVRMTPEIWESYSTREKEAYLREAYTLPMIEGKNGKFYRTRVTDVEEEDMETVINVQFDEIDENGNLIRKDIAGSVRRLQMEGNPPSMYNNSFFIHKESDKGADLATIYNGVAFRYLEKIGVEQAQVSPADDGQYIWARVGFKNEQTPLDANRIQNFTNAMRTYELMGPAGLIKTDEEYQRAKTFVELFKSGTTLHVQDAIFMMDSGNIQDLARRDYIKHWFIEHMPLFSGATLNFADQKISKKSLRTNLRRKNLVSDRGMRYARQI